MSDAQYLVDNNALSGLTRGQRQSAFLRKHCLIPQDLLYEARGFADADLDEVNTQPVTIDILERLKRIMATVPIDDMSLVDLYANKGTADPVLIATALSIMDEEQQTLLPRECVILTDDKAVRAKAWEFGVAVMTVEDFTAQVAASM